MHFQITPVLKNVLQRENGRNELKISYVINELIMYS
jgi:hypothetical protein